MKPIKIIFDYDNGSITYIALNGQQASASGFAGKDLFQKQSLMDYCNEDGGTFDTEKNTKTWVNPTIPGELHQFIEPLIGECYQKEMEAENRLNERIDHNGKVDGLYV